MKSLRFVLSVVLMSLSTVAFAQSDAQKSFDQLKTLAGTGKARTPPTGGRRQDASSLRVTSRGNAIVHEMKGSGDPTIRSPCFTWMAIACS